MTIRDLYTDSLVKNSILLTMAAFFSGLLNYFFQFFCSRKLSVAEFGELQSLLALTAFISIIGAAISYFIIKHNSALAKNRDYASSNAFLNILRRKSKGIYIVLFFIIILLAPIVFYGLRINLINYFLIALASLLSMTITIKTSFLQSWQEFKYSSLTGILTSITKLFFVIILLTILPKVFSAVLTYVLSVIITMLFLLYLFRKMGFGIKKDVNADALLKYFSFDVLKKSIIPIFIYTLFITLLQNSDVLIVKFYGTAELTGYYSVLSMMGKIILWVNFSIIGALLPHACADCHDGRMLSKNIKKLASSLLIFVGGCAITLYYFFPSIIIKLLFGSKYLIMHAYLWYFGVFALIMTLISYELSLHFARGRYKLAYVLCAPIASMLIFTHFYHSQVIDIILINIFSFLATYILILIIKYIERYGEARLNRGANI